jgi:Mrp family chromosome partitioning ATPase
VDEPAPPTVGTASIATTEPEAALASLYATLEWHLGELAASEDAHHANGIVIGVTSAVAGEGKTTVALEIALQASRSSHLKVCVIDFGLGGDDIGARLGWPSTGRGLCDLLDGQDRIGAMVSVPSVRLGPECGGLTVIRGGRAPRNAARAARSPVVSAVIGQARRSFDLVILDLPTVASGNALPVLQCADRAVIVVCAGVTPRDLVNDALDRIGRDRALGVVLNQVPVRKAASRGRAARSR